MRFVTLFPNCKNVDLVKDVGQIPYNLSRNHDEIEAVVVSSKIDINGANVDKVGDLKIETVKMLKNEALTGLIYLLRNSRKIDWLNVYHSGRQSRMWNKVYKRLNPKGKSYLKLDLDFRSCDAFDNDYIERKRFIEGLEGYDLVSVESEAIYNRIKQYVNRKIEIIGNGYCKSSNSISTSSGFVPKEKRDNIFVTAGRLGTEQKATDELMTAFAKSADKHNWKLIMAGTIEPDFRKFMDDYYAKYPELIGRVVYEGQIEDREKIYALYNSAKVFVLPSRWEGYPLVIPEAMSCGLRILVSDSVPSAWEAVPNEEFGKITETGNIEGLSDAFCSMALEDTSDELIEKISEYADRTFSWDIICERLYKHIAENGTI